MWMSDWGKAAVRTVLTGLKNRSYDKGLLGVRLEGKKLGRPVISVGGLAFGGTGKTPFTEELARLLSGEGYLVCILSGGYRSGYNSAPLVVSDYLTLKHGPTEAGDEAFLLARNLPGVPVVVGKERLEAGRHALQPGNLVPVAESLPVAPVHLFLLDSGFQHRRLHRDLDLVLLDAADPWGDRGQGSAARNLRESRSALRRSHGIILTRAQCASDEEISKLREELSHVAPGVAVFTARSQPLGLRRQPGGPLVDPSELHDLRLFAFAGIGRPESFFSDLEATGAELVGREKFDDHAPYSEVTMRRLQHKAEELGAAAMVTTEKDAVRLPLVPGAEPPLYTLQCKMVLDDTDGIMRLVASRLPGASRDGHPLG